LFTTDALQRQSVSNTGHKERKPNPTMILTATAPKSISTTLQMDRKAAKRLEDLVARVMQQTDDLVIVFEYLGKDGSVTRRVVSPIRFVGTDRFLALCLSREEPRQFVLGQCRNVRVDLAARYTMPVALQSLSE
jgi:predicted DNA-binding transcriptional regulator YafY